MKRILLLFFFISVILNTFSETTGFSRWSITAEYGYNYFGGDINQNIINYIPTTFTDITYGGNIEYALNPVWGLALDAYYLPLRAKGKNQTTMNINTNLITSDFNVTINFTRWIFPHTKSKFNFNGSIGIGYAYYTVDIRYPDGTAIPGGDTYFDSKNSGMLRPIHLYENGQLMKTGLATSIPITFSLEYNFSNPLSIGAKVHYRAFAKDNLEGATELNTDGISNDYIAAGTLFLRYKFNSKNKLHLRNITWDEFEPNEALLLAQKLDIKVDKLNNRVDTLNNKVDSILPRIAKLENLLSNDGPDEDGDGVPDVRDNSANTPPNTAVDFWGKPLQVATTNLSNKSGINLPDDIPAVYFDFDQIELDNDALITIQKIAAKMITDPTLYVEVRGYCDYAGNNPYNNLLSQRRSDRVKAEMVNVWGIPFDHIIPNGKGKIIEPRSKYRPNRRCDFFFGRL